MRTHLSFSLAIIVSVIGSAVQAQFVTFQPISVSVAEGKITLKETVLVPVTKSVQVEVDKVLDGGKILKVIETRTVTEYVKVDKRSTLDPKTAKVTVVGTGLIEPEKWEKFLGKETLVVRCSQPLPESAMKLFKDGTIVFELTPPLPPLPPLPPK